MILSGSHLYNYRGFHLLDHSLYCISFVYPIFLLSDSFTSCINWLQGECDRTTSEMRVLSPKIISGDSRRSENAQTHTNKHTIPNMKFKLKLLQIKCHVLGFTKEKAPKCASKELIRVLRKRSSLTIGTRSSP
jgi:hypothetical protein